MGRLKSALHSLAKRGSFEMTPSEPFPKTIPIAVQSVAAAEPPCESEVVERGANEPPIALEPDDPQSAESEAVDAQPDEPGTVEPKAADQSSNDIQPIGHGTTNAPESCSFSDFDDPGFAQPLDPITVVQMESDGNESPFEPVVIDAMGDGGEVEAFDRCFDTETPEMNALRAQLEVVTKQQTELRDHAESPNASLVLRAPDEADCTPPLASDDQETETPAEPVAIPDESIAVDSGPELLRPLAELTYTSLPVNFFLDDDVEASVEERTERAAALVEQELGINPSIRVNDESTNDEPTTAIVAKSDAASKPIPALYRTSNPEGNSAPTPTPELQPVLGPEEETLAHSASQIKNTSAYAPVIQPWSVPLPDENKTEEGAPVAAATALGSTPEPKLSGPAPPYPILDMGPSLETRPQETAPLWIPSSSPVAHNVPEVAEKLEPTAYEISTAERLLQSDFGDRIQQLNSQLQSHLHGDGPHVVMMLSIGADEQRADVVSGLGMFTCAHRPDETLIVDADIDARLVSRGFEKRGAGLLEEISGQIRWNDSVQPTSCEKLRVLPCGSDLDMVASSFDQLNRIQELIGEWKNQYGLVLIDGGLGSSRLALSMSRLVDATYVCVRLGQDHRQELLATSTRIAQAGGKVTGCITTGSSEEK